MMRIGCSYGSFRVKDNRRQQRSESPFYVDTSEHCFILDGSLRRTYNDIYERMKYFVIEDIKPNYAALAR